MLRNYSVFSTVKLLAKCGQLYFKKNLVHNSDYATKPLISAICSSVVFIHENDPVLRYSQVRNCCVMVE